MALLHHLGIQIAAGSKMSEGELTPGHCFRPGWQHSRRHNCAEAFIVGVSWAEFWWRKSPQKDTLHSTQQQCKGITPMQSGLL